MINATWNCAHTCGAPTTLNEGQKRVRLNRIHDKVYGIYLTESGGGIYEENRIHNIRGTGIYVSSDCSPVLSNNLGVP